MPGAFDVKSQLTFYGAYHSNSVNVGIHMVCVPLIIWSALVWLSAVPLPEFLSAFDIKPLIINDYMRFEPSSAWIAFAVYQGYYFILEPVAALIYLPFFLTSLSIAGSFVHRPHAMLYATAVHLAAWSMQFVGHGKFEKRAPAFLDNIVGAFILAPFFVHLETLFKLGYRKDFYKQLHNDIGVEVARVRKAEGDKRRAKQQ